MSNPDQQIGEVIADRPAESSIPPSESRLSGISTTELQYWITALYQLFDEPDLSPYFRQGGWGGNTLRGLANKLETERLFRRVS